MREGCPRVGGQQELLEHLGQSPRIGHDAVGVPDDQLVMGVGTPGCVDPFGQQLCAGVEQRQRRTELVSGIGDEASLELECLSHRSHRPPCQQGGEQSGQHQSHAPGQPEGAEDPFPFLVLLEETGHGLDHLITPLDGQHAIAARRDRDRAPVLLAVTGDLFHHGEIRQPGRH